jgi:tetratricopeptide (TPR) repeat protein
VLRRILSQALVACRLSISGRNQSHLSAVVGEARARAASGDYAGSLETLQEIVRDYPDWPEGHRVMGAMLAAAGELQRAQGMLLRALQLDDSHAGAHSDLANVQRLLGLHQHAEQSFQRALEIDPTLQSATIGLAITLDLRGRYEEAIQLLEAALLLSDDASLIRATISIMDRRGKHREAKDLCHRILRKNNSNAVAHASLGFILLKREYNAEGALDHFTQADLAGATDSEMLANRGIALQDLGRIDEAISSYSAALDLDPRNHVARFHRSLAYLLKGEYSKGWPDYEMRLISDDRPQRTFPYPRWNGEPCLRKTVLVYAEQGVGDEIMFASCVPDLLQRCGHVVIECASKLAPIMTRSFPEASVRGGTQFDDMTWLSTLPAIDRAIPIGSLPLHLRRTVDEFPRHSGYLRADPEKVAHKREWLQTLGPGLKVGLSWRGGTAVSRGSLRSLGSEQLQAVFSVKGAHFVNLQYDSTPAELDEFVRFSASFHDCPGAMSDYDATAALVCALDVVVSVCTAIVHLGGALGKVVWVLAPKSAEWRYGLTGEDMSWYPSVKVFRQRKRGDWSVPLDEVSRRLKEMIAPP